MTFLLVLHRKNKHFEGLFQNFKMTALFEIVVRQEYEIKKFWFFFLGTIFWFLHA
jgi:hypothetical protein